MRNASSRSKSSGKRSAEREFQYKTDKYLFELKTHPHLRKHYDKSVALVSGFRNQKPPTHCTVAEYEEWKRRRLTRAKVLAVLRRHIRRQNEVPRKEIALVKTSYGYKFKAYAPHLLDKIERREVSFRELVAAGERLPELPRMNKKQKEQYRQAGKLIARKRKEFLRQQAPFSEMAPDSATKNWKSASSPRCKSGIWACCSRNAILC